MTPGFHAGVIADFSISDNVFVQPGILVSQKGFRIEESVMGFTIKNTTSLLYAEIPVNIGYRLELGDNAKLYFMAGPYVGYGITGKSKTQVTGSPSETEDVEWGNEAGELKRLDFGVNAGAGVEISNILIGAQYGLGLSNNIAEGDKDNSFKNAVIGISLGYLFGGK